MPIKPENRDDWRKLSIGARIGRASPYGERLCSFCGENFSPYRMASIYCGRNCRRRAETARSRSVLTCKRCLLPIEAASAKAIYCGERCKAADVRAKLKSDPERISRHRDSARRYSKTERYRFNQANLKAMRRAVMRSGGLTFEEWSAIKRRFGGRCAYCGERKKLTMDHVHPISRGGRHDATNIVPACQPCNSRKGATDWSDRICR